MGAGPTRNTFQFCPRACNLGLAWQPPVSRIGCWVSFEREQSGRGGLEGEDSTFKWRMMEGHVSAHTHTQIHLHRTVVDRCGEWRERGFSQVGLTVGADIGGILKRLICRFFVGAELIRSLLGNVIFRVLDGLK